MSTWEQWDFSRFKGVTVYPRGEPERDIKRFMRKCREEIDQEARESLRFVKPCDERRRKRSRAEFIRKVREREER